jgi:O-antigen/teichoic acid export membrane protein
MNIIKDSSVIVAGIIISNILAYIFHFVVGRALGPADYGVFGALTAVFTILSIPSSAFGSAIVKFSSKLAVKKQFGKIGFLRKKMQDIMIIFGIVVFLTILVFSSQIASYLNINSSIPVIVTGFVLVFALISPVNRGVLQGLKKFKDYSINGILESASRLVLVLVFLVMGMRVSGALLAYGLAYFIAFLAIFPLIKETRKKERFEINGFYKFVLIVLLTMLFMQILINAPTIFIKHYFSAEFTGFWNAALNLARISLLVTGGISIVMFPEVAGEKKQKNKKKIFGKALLLTLISSVVISILFFILGSLAVSLLYGSAYLPAVPILEWMGLAMIFLSVIQLGISYWLAER